jgi:hypothetical protein
LLYATTFNLSFEKNALHPASLINFLHSALESSTHLLSQY